MEEQWVVVKDFPNYSVSNLGRVFSNRLNREIYKGVDRRGYYSVGLRHDGARGTRMVHRLVAEAFVPGFDEGLVVNHIDGDKLNNVYSNLEWVTSSENMFHAHRMWLTTRAFKPVRIVETDQVFWSIKECAAHLNTHSTAISAVLRGTRRSHKGYTFEYVKKEVNHVSRALPPSTRRP